MSSVTKDGIPEVWQQMQEYRKCVMQSGELMEKRMEQRKRWMWRLIDERLIASFRKEAQVMDALPLVQKRLFDGELTPFTAAQTLLDIFMRQNSR